MTLRKKIPLASLSIVTLVSLVVLAARPPHDLENVVIRTVGSEGQSCHLYIITWKGEVEKHIVTDGPIEFIGSGRTNGLKGTWANVRSGTRLIVNKDMRKQRRAYLSYWYAFPPSESKDGIDAVGRRIDACLLEIGKLYRDALPTSPFGTQTYRLLFRFSSEKSGRVETGADYLISDRDLTADELSHIVNAFWSSSGA